MSIIDYNTKLLYDMYNVDEYKECLKDIKIEGIYLVYKKSDGTSIKADISKINLYDVIANNPSLKNNLKNFTSENFVKLVGVYSKFHSTSLRNINKEYIEHNRRLLEQLQNTEPAMKDICVFTKKDNTIEKEYYSIVDSSGKPHIFYNELKKDLGVIYSEIKRKNMGSLTADQIIEVFKDQLIQVELSNSFQIEQQKNSKDFKQKYDFVKEKNEANKNINIYGNDEHDVIVTSDTMNRDNNNIYTSKRDVDGNLIYNIKNQYRKDNQSFKDIDTEEKITKTQDEIKSQKIEIDLIDYEDFINLLDNEDILTENEQEQIDLWLATLGDIKIYEDYLTPDILNYLKMFDKYIHKLEQMRNEGLLNDKQANALEEYYEIFDPDVIKKEQDKLTDHRLSMDEEQYVRKLNNLDNKKKQNTYNNNTNGNIYLTLILTAIGIACLTIIYIISIFMK